MKWHWPINCNWCLLNVTFCWGLVLWNIRRLFESYRISNLASKYYRKSNCRVIFYVLVYKQYTFGKESVASILFVELLLPSLIWIGPWSILGRLIRRPADVNAGIIRSFALAILLDDGLGAELCRTTEPRCSDLDLWLDESLFSLKK